MNALKEQSLYCNQMSEIIWRDALLRRMLSGEVSLGSEAHDYEIFSLNMRKILELIAFSSLISIKAKYKSEYPNFVKHYKAKAILKDVEKIHPNFFPTPGSIETLECGNKSLSTSEKAENALTRKEFEELYDKCTTVLHAWKPYSTDPKHVDFRIAPIDWLNKVRDLLNIHYVHLPDNNETWLCVMKGAQDHKPHVYTLSPVKNSTSSQMWAFIVQPKEEL